MFGRRKKDYRRHPNIVFVIFRLILSLLIFAVLLGGIYSAIKNFSGVDPVKVSPKALINSFASPEKLMSLGFSLLSLDLGKISAQFSKAPGVISQGSQKIQGQVSGQNAQGNQTSQKNQVVRRTVSFKFALVADSHNENDYLTKALKQAKDINVQFIIGLGDYSEVGTISEFENAKKEFDSAGIRYFVTAGDHDLWDSRNKSLPPLTNFNQVFGPSNQAFGFGNARIIILDNSDNYLGLGKPQLEWLNDQLNMVKNQPEINIVFAFLHEPLYHPSSTRVMGKVTEGLKSEAKKLAKILKDGGVKEVFSGDIHFFTRYQDPESNLSMTTIGAITSLRNTQEPRFGVVTVYEDGSYEVEDVGIK